MIYLATASGPTVRDAISRYPYLGHLLSPGGGRRVPLPDCAWAIDNGRFGQQWTPARWLRLLDRNAGKPGCLFASVPDVVGDAAATDDEWPRWAPEVIARGYPPAYVAQNGCHAIPDDARALFIGGDTPYKLGADARRIVAQAHRRGLWVHMGRVNSLRRLRYAADLGCRSVDGTFITIAPNTNLVRLLAWFNAPQQSLGGIA